jgi:DegV family protein with EDD domain
LPAFISHDERVSMTEHIKIITDSSADVPVALQQELGIAVVSLTIAFGARVYADAALPRDEFWRLVKEYGAPQSSQPSVGAFEVAFRAWVEQGYQVICYTITSHHSGSYSSACTAARPFGERVVVVDSGSISWGHGRQVILAAQMARQGASVSEITAATESLRQRSLIALVLDAAEFLRQGGRTAALMPVIDRFARVLSLKPMLTVIEGEIKFLGVARTYAKGVERLKEEVQRLGGVEYVGLVHNRRPEIAAAFAEELLALTGLPREQIEIGDGGSVLACHTGDGLLAMIAITPRRG